MRERERGAAFQDRKVPWKPDKMAHVSCGFQLRAQDLFVICEAALEDGLPNFVVREVPEQSVG